MSMDHNTRTLIQNAKSDIEMAHQTILALASGVGPKKLRSHEITELNTRLSNAKTFLRAALADEETRS